MLQHGGGTCARAEPAGDAAGGPGEGHPRLMAPAAARDLAGRPPGHICWVCSLWAGPASSTCLQLPELWSANSGP